MALEGDIDGVWRDAFFHLCETLGIVVNWYASALLAFTIFFYSSMS